MDDERYLGENDWEDQDLLTIDEARYRLEAEARVTVERVQELRAEFGADDARTIREQRRLDLLQQRLADQVTVVAR